MRVLAIHRYYWPDTAPYASLLRAIVAQWGADGHLVDVLSSQPSYKPEAGLEKRPRVEMVDRARVRRVAMWPDRGAALRRLVNVVRFSASVGIRALAGKKYDVVMCSTAPPVLLAAVVSMAARARGARFVYHCMDLHPEIGALSGDFAHPLLFRLLRRIDTATCRRSNCVVVLSGDMREALLRREPRLVEKIVVLNNFELPDFDDERGQAAGSAVADGDGAAHLRGPLRIVFAGNVGRFQGLDVLVRAVLAADARLGAIELTFMGEGAAKAELERLAAEAPSDARPRVRFLPHSPPREARSQLRGADAGLVSLTPKVINFAYPSKTATYLSEGLPLLAAVDPSSELARMVERERVGWCLPLADEETVKDCLLTILEQRADLPVMRARARSVWARDFSAEMQLPRWGRLLADLGNNR